MNVRDDYLLRVIAEIAETIKRMIAGESVSASKIDEVLEDLLGISLSNETNHIFIKQIIDLATNGDENKKAFVACCLHLKDQNKYAKIVAQLRGEINAAILDSAVQNLMRQTVT